MTLSNGGGTTPGQASPLMNAAATKPQVLDHCPTDSSVTDSPHGQQVRGCLVLVVETPGGRYRRRTFLTLAAAERACRNARDAGHPASVVVAQLVPVAVVA